MSRGRHGTPELSRSREEAPEPEALLTEVRVVVADYGYPLAGARVLAMTGGRERARPPIGEAVTDRNGVARVPVRTRAIPPDRHFRLVVYAPAGRTAAGEAEARRGLPLWIEARYPLTPPDQRTWRSIAQVLERNRIARFHELAAHLLLKASGGSVLEALPVSVRLGALADLEEAFLDPSGALRKAIGPISFYRLRGHHAWEHLLAGMSGEEIEALADEVRSAKKKSASFASVSEIDYVLDLEKLGAGDLGGATLLSGDWSFAAGESAAPGPLAFPVDADLVGYRNYLRTIFTGGKPGELVPTPPQYGKQLVALERRFGQDFETTYTVESPANALAAQIVKGLLTRPTGNQYGFGLSAGQIEPKGDRSEREYLDYLIGLTKLSETELGHRYRLDLSRNDGELSSPVQENIFALQRFYADGFQGMADPYPIIPSDLLGRSPFFLEYEEWLDRKRPFFAENVFPMKDSFGSGVPRKYRKLAQNASTGGWFAHVLAAEDGVEKGHEAFGLGEYRLAIDHYLKAWEEAYAVLQKESHLDEAATKWQVYFQGLPAEDEEDLDALVERLALRGASALNGEPPHPWGNPSKELELWLDSGMTEIQHLNLLRLCIFVIPSCLGDATLALGDYAAANDLFAISTRFLAAHARPRDPAGWVDEPQVTPSSGQDHFGHVHYVRGPLAYSADTSTWPDGRPWFGHPKLKGRMTLETDVDRFHALAEAILPITHPVERRWLRLRHANALLDWADALYRTDDASSIPRARELYKAALLIHGFTPPTEPTWGSYAKYDLLFGAQPNPALQSQVAHARAGLAQIEAGVNFYGYTDELVPALRYRTLKQAADRFAAAAKAAQNDLLVYFGRIEDVLQQRIIQASALTKAGLSAQLAREQARVALANVEIAKLQIAEVQAKIEALQKEIDDHDSFFGQAKDFFSGMKGSIEDLPSSGTATTLSGLGSVAGFGTYKGVGFFSGVGAGPAALAGYGVFVYAGYTSMQAMADAQNSRQGRLIALKTRALPAAKLALRVRQIEVGIAQLQEKIADADAELARQLLRFAELRTLNISLWGDLAFLARRILGRLLELGGRHAWLAERALAYEQDRDIDIVRLDYVPEERQGIGGADLLLADLAELEAARLDALRVQTPITYTASLAFQHPVAFTQLRKEGKCRFETSDQSLREAHRGSFAHRITSVSVVPQTLSSGPSFTGMLRNDGVSFVCRADGTDHLRLRPPDGQPVSDYRWPSPATGLFEGETLRPFEGSGLTTSWVLELPAAANPYPESALADVHLIFELTAGYSPELYELEAAAPATKVERAIVLSGAAQAPGPIAALKKGAAQADIPFNIPAALPKKESQRVIENVGLVLAAPPGANGTVTILAPALTAPLTIPVEKGVAISNAPPLSDPANPAPPSPLNALVGLDAATPLTVRIASAALSEVDWSKLSDVVLAVSYRAEA